MIIDVMNTDTSITIKPWGMLEYSSAHDLQLQIDEIDFSDKEVYMDLTNVYHVTSSGFRTIVSARKKAMEGKFHVINAAEQVIQEFVANGVDFLVDIKTLETETETAMVSLKEAIAIYKQYYADTKAVIYHGREYTWYELEVCSHIIASDLEKLGATIGTHIGIMGSNSFNWIATFFAVQKLGGIACLLNYNYTPEELNKVVGIGDIEILCVGNLSNDNDSMDYLQKLISLPDYRPVSMFEFSDNYDFTERWTQYRELRGHYERKVFAEDSCVMIFTSGSTGNPKGVLLSAFNIMNAGLSMAKSMRITSVDRACLVLPLYHVFGLCLTYIACVMRGAEIYIPDDTHSTSLFDAFSKGHCTSLNCVPTTILAMVKNKQFSQDKLKGLRTVVLGGAPIAEAQMRKLYELLPQTHFVTAYGLSEIVPVSLTEYEDTVEHICTTVGRASKSVSIKIADMSTGETLPVNQKGEVLVTGYGLMCSYYKIPLDKQAIDEEGWLHTGDIGYMDEEDYLHLDGRIKELIIRGGENIMPKEVAEVVCEFPDVSDAKIIGIPDEFFGEKVCACIDVNEGKSINENDIKEYVAGKLAAFKVPEYWLFYEDFPLLSNGKVDMVSLKKDAIEKIKGDAKA